MKAAVRALAVLATAAALPGSVVHRSCIQRLPLFTSLQILIKAVAFFAGAVIIARNFGEAPHLVTIAAK